MGAYAKNDIPQPQQIHRPAETAIESLISCLYIANQRGGMPLLEEAAEGLRVGCEQELLERIMYYDQERIISAFPPYVYRTKEKVCKKALEVAIDYAIRCHSRFGCRSVELTWGKRHVLSTFDAPHACFTGASRWRGGAPRRSASSFWSHSQAHARSLRASMTGSGRCAPTSYRRPRRQLCGQTPRRA